MLERVDHIRICKQIFKEPKPHPLSINYLPVISWSGRIVINLNYI